MISALLCISHCHNNNNDLLPDPLGGSFLLNYINCNCKIYQIKLFTNYTVDTGLAESKYNKTNQSLCTLLLKKFLESLDKVTFINLQVVRNIEFLCELNCVICLVSSTLILIPCG